MRLWSSESYIDGFWFRILGYGLAFYKQSLFSDRYFKRKKYFGYHIRILKP